MSKQRDKPTNVWGLKWITVYEQLFINGPHDLLSFLYNFITPMLFSQFSETAGTRGCTEDGCHPGKEAPCWSPQWLVFPRQAPSGGAGAPCLRGQRPSRQQLQAEQPDQRQVSRGNTCILYVHSGGCYCSLQETEEYNSQKYFQECLFLGYFISHSQCWSCCWRASDWKFIL